MFSRTGASFGRFIPGTIPDCSSNKGAMNPSSATLRSRAGQVHYSTHTSGWRVDRELIAGAAGSLRQFRRTSAASFNLRKEPLGLFVRGEIIISRADKHRNRFNFLGVGDFGKWYLRSRRNNGSGD